MSTTVVEELPLIRSKCERIGNATGTNANVGPCTYDVDFSRLESKNANVARAPFNTTAQRPPLSQGDPRVPGPGKYDTIEAPDHRVGIASCPFLSGTARFQPDDEARIPGPGEYNVEGKWPHKPSSRSHKFSELQHGEPGGTSGGSAAIGPGYYNPSHSVSSRTNPKVSHFSKYSARTAPRPSGNPGPGAYDANVQPRTLYTQKPSSMFATKTTRMQQGIKDTPGPGDYEIASSLGRKTPARSLGRSAFGTSAARFNDASDKAGLPGPGWYTDEIAQRRPVYRGSVNTHPFSSTADRFHDEFAFGPGPGSYNASKRPKRLHFGGDAPFNSTVPRFAATVDRYPALDFDEAFGPAYYTARRAPQRTKPKRSFVAGGIKPSSQPEQLPERIYDVKYDWPKPTSLGSGFDTATRSNMVAADNGVPGPGSYGADGATPGRGKGNSTWGKEVRFAATGTERSGSVGPGRYHHESTFLNKSFNCTIGSDVTW